MTAQDQIANAWMVCNMDTGYWNIEGTGIISDPLQTVSSSTGLAAVLLGNKGGYRVFYRDIGGALRQLRYTQDAQRFSDAGLVNQDSSNSSAIGALLAAPNSDNMTVIAPKDMDNMEVTRWYSDYTWRASK